MTLTEAAELLGVTPDNLRGAIQRGTLRATKIGRDWHVDQWAVDLYRRQHLRDVTVPFVGISYPIEFRVFVTEDGGTQISAFANVSGDGSGPMAEAETIEAAVALLRERMSADHEVFTTIEDPE